MASSSANGTPIQLLRQRLQGRLNALDGAKFLCCVFIDPEWRGYVLGITIHQESLLDAGFTLNKVRLDGALYLFKLQQNYQPQAAEVGPDSKWKLVDHARENMIVDVMEERSVNRMVEFLQNGKIELEDGSDYRGLLPRTL